MIKTNFRTIINYSILILFPIIILELTSFLIILLFTNTGITDNNMFVNLYRDGSVYKKVDIPSNIFHPYIGWTHPKNTKINTSKLCSKDTYIYTNKLGQSTVPGFNKNSEKIIVFLGGSTIFGVGSTDNAHTIPSLVQRKLISQGLSNYSVVNLGLRGAQSFQELMVLYRYIMYGGKTDWVIDLSGRNDAYHAAFEKDIKYSLIPVHPHRTALKIRKMQDGRGAPIYIHGLLQGARYYSFTLDLISRFLTKFYGTGNNDITMRTDLENDKTSISMWVDSTIRNYTMIDRLTKYNNGKYVMILQPTAYTKQKLTNSEHLCIKNTERLKYYKEYEKLFFNEVNNKEKPFPFYDARYIFSENLKTLHYVDNIHYNDEAADALADYIVNIIVNK